MSAEALQVAVLIASGAAVVLVPLLIVLLASRIRNAAHQSTQTALNQAARQHEGALAEFTRNHDRSLGELTRQHERAIADYARQHERALAELATEHKRIAQEFGMFSQKRHEVYARLYARYRRATASFAEALSGQEPEFKKFSRDDLLRYLKQKDIRERDATDALAAMDRGDIFAMNKLMSKLHWRVTVRDATTKFERAREFEALNELYLSDAVNDAVGNLRRKVDVIASSLTREVERGDQAGRAAKEGELQSLVASLLYALRSDLRAAGTEARPKPRVELDRVPPRGSLPAPSVLADKAAPAQAVSEH